MHDELVKRLRTTKVTVYKAEDVNLLQEAADAIEGLVKDLERSREWEAFWEKEANEALKKFQTTVASMPRWIPVTERLPEEYVDVLCYCSRNGEYGCGAWHKEDKTIYWTGLDGMIPTHWMPLPPAPKEESYGV